MRHVARHGRACRIALRSPGEYRRVTDPSAHRRPLFVFGTLKRGGSNAARLTGATFVGERRTAPGYCLHRLGAYPVLVQTGEGVVSGELYLLTEPHLAALDEFEGCPTLYQRRTIRLGDGTEAEAYTRLPAAVLGLPVIPGGRFDEE